MTDQTETLADRAWRWAQGSPLDEAALIIVTEAVGGAVFDRVAHCFTDWPDEGRAAPDWEAIAILTGPMSGGERRLLSIALSLVNSQPVTLGDACTGLDEANAAIALDALAHALSINPNTPVGGSGRGLGG